MQKKNRKGFTLIELLAVIVILAIIALIAVPVIMNVIKNARKSAFEDSAYGVIEAAELYYSNKLLEPEGMTEDQEFIVVDGVFKNEKGDKLPISGSLPSSGKVTITKEGKVALAISNGEYYMQKATVEDKVEAKLLKEDGVIENELKYKTVFVAASDGTEVPACITNNTECTAEDIKNGLKVGVKVNDSETKDFYVISEDTEKGTITLILNQNLGETVAWASKDDYIAAGGTESDYGEYGNNKGPVTALKALEERTSSWTNIPSETYELTDDNKTPLYSIKVIKAKARLLTKTEASKLGCEVYNSSTCPDWLYGNLRGSSHADGYWTSSTYVHYHNCAWIVYYNGSTGDTGIEHIRLYGVRPVITVSKTMF